MKRIKLTVAFCWVAGLCLAADGPGHDWTQFGWDASSSGASPDPTGITAANAKTLVRHQVELGGVADSSAIYLHDVTVQGSKLDVFFVITAYGKTIAVDANKASILWTYTPPKYDTWNTTVQLTNSTPAADPDRLHIYTTAPDGVVRKLTVAEGKEVWSTPITLLPGREKMDSPLRVFRGHVVAVTGGYIGDAPPYQGHVAVLDAKDGKLLNVWNSLCSDRTGLLIPDSCAATQSAIWGRAGAVIDQATGNIFVATGNGPYDGKTSWGDALIELDPDATKMIGNWTPSNNAQLRQRDVDMGSVSPVLLGGGYLVQGGKDRLFRLMTIDSIAGAAPNQNENPLTLSTPSGDRLFTAAAVWHRGADTFMFSADAGGTAAWSFKDGKLTQVWKNTNGGTSPVVAGGLLYVYDIAGKLRIYDAEKGELAAELACGPGHWSSPIVVDGKIALPEGNSRRQAPANGVLNIWSLPSQ